VQLTIDFEQWITFCRSLSQLDQQIWDSSIKADKWSVKSIVSHIMLWDRYFYEEAIRKIASNQEITLIHQDFDEFNQKAIQYARNITADQLLKDAIDIREKIIATIRSLSEEQIEYHYVDGDGRVFQVKQYLIDFIWHDQHHMKPLAKYIIEKGYDITVEREGT